jgi:thiosulfate dehydrogenase
MERSDETPAPSAQLGTARPASVFTPPARGAYPAGEFGEAVKRGEAIFHDTKTNAGRFVGNDMSCASCHLDDGRRADSTPMWAAWGLYPAYRKKNGRVSTMAGRLQGCFTFSMNAPASEAGHAPDPLDPVIVELESYIYWLATGAPVGVKLKGQGYPELAEPALPPDLARGEAIYEAECMICHGESGQGMPDPDARQAFPPLWGDQSYNWGAGMHRTNTAAAFIRANMPFGKPDTLSEQEAWDVALFINSQERPVDPRQAGGSIEDADKNYHDERCQYGEDVGGTLGDGR